MRVRVRVGVGVGKRDRDSERMCLKHGIREDMKLFDGWIFWGSRFRQVAEVMTTAVLRLRSTPSML